MKIDDVEALFCEVGKSNYVKVCRAGGRKISEFVPLLCIEVFIQGL